MTEDELILLAMGRLSALSKGINPYNGAKLKDVDFDDERMGKLVEFVIECLTRLLSEGEKLSKVPGLKREKFNPYQVDISKIKIVDEEIGVNSLSAIIKGASNIENMMGLSGKIIADWLVSLGYLKLADGRKVLTEKSPEIGLNVRKNVNISTGEPYMQVVYSSSAQSFVIEHLADIVRWHEEERKNKRTKHKHIT